jgi:cytochrome c1
MASRLPTLTGVAVVAVLIVAGGMVGNRLLSHRNLDTRVAALTGGDPGRGRALLKREPCGGCHEIPGVAGAKGHVGPSLVHFADRVYIGGRAQNTPDNLVRWMQDPSHFEPGTAMPPTPLSDREARDIAAYLYTLG